MNGEWPCATLTRLSVDKESTRKNRGLSNPVVTSEITAVDFDEVMKQYCKTAGINPLRSCDAFIQFDDMAYLVEFKNREVFFTHPMGNAGRTQDNEKDESANRANDADSEQRWENLLEQRDLQQELIEKLYDSAIVLDGLCQKDYRLIQCRDRLVGFIVVSRTKNYELGSYNDEMHAGFYSSFRTPGDPMKDALAMTSMNVANTDDSDETRFDASVSSAHQDEYDGWYCPRGIRRLEGRLYRKIMFMTASQFLRFLDRRGITATAD